ncbi:alpha/beta hydrolase [Draconibacterium halophilum]|uniref:Alpha/beta hydrolase n=1 Tax=Draconibacterium halophilum TaxID=2706887 RepID=A0A6C0REF8_9BACT|nr:alpha/beta hydrolase [Draconibacterium halophilum]QIA08964.1 alpha/beta hydrolase [Draconibacterium halophilum]
MKRIKRFLLIAIVLVIIAYLLGPKPPKPELNKDLPSLSASIANIESYIEKKEASFSVKPDNESRIVWANDSIKERTNYCVLYLHGFSASWYEGHPAHERFAQHLGANLYIPRLHNHGLVTEDPLIDMTPDKLYASAKEAMMVARTLGQKVIIMSTSTGGTLGLKLAADFPEYIDGLILYSPNIKVNNSSMFLLSKPWGLQIARNVMGGKYRITNDDFDSVDCKYWNCKYRVEALVYLQQLVEATMTSETFNRVHVPVFLGYYYKDDEHQDQTVSVDAMLDMFNELGTVPNKKVKKAFPEAGDHVIACELTSGSVEEVIAETIRFGEDVLNLERR